MKYITTIFTILIFCAAFGFSVTAQTNQQQDRPLKIKSKPRVPIGDCRQEQGVTRLRVTFDKSEKVTTIEMLASSGCESFDENSIRATKKIKFDPQIKDGEPVTVTKQVEYAFTRY